jgi:hypothetical protein
MLMPLSLTDRARYAINIFLTILFTASLGWAGGQSVKNSAQWSGIIINNNCTADEAFAEAEKCTANVPGAKRVLYDDTTRQIFDLEPQAPATGHLGDAVTVYGALDGKTIHVSSLERLASIGLPAGQKAPAFSARDQFGREQTLETLKGSHGTILLFFRSADW